ncbi:MAG: FAD:protein FMN transferase [Nitrospirae bacterium]|nr:MAG: FAD:protein FMN transferase [Nitrospirota bacterium]
MQRRAALFLLACIPFFTACAIIPISHPSQASVSKLPSSPVTLKRAQFLMGTLVELTAVAPSDAIAQASLTAGFQEIRRLENMLSTWIETSELSRVNQAAGLEPVGVSAETFELLRRALEAAEYTEGGFNIAIGPAVQLWNIPEAPRIPSAMELEIAAQYVDYRRIHLDQTRRTVFLEKPGMRIDIGGIGKGFAAEKAAAVMREIGATGGLVAVAGDFRVFGRRADGTAWPIGIQHPRKPGKILAMLDAIDEAISTSGDYERYFMKDGVRYHHILDPETLQPARLCRSVTIIAPDATTADALATGVFVMGPVRGMALVERLGLGAVIVDAQGMVIVSARLRDRVKLAP